MKQNILNRGIIDEIQKHLAELNWVENRDYHSIALKSFLEGAKYACRAGVTFKLANEIHNYTRTFKVDVSKYSELNNAFSDKELLFSIYEDRIDYYVDKI